MVLSIVYCLVLKMNDVARPVNAIEGPKAPDYLSTAAS